MLAYFAYLQAWLQLFNIGDVLSALTSAPKLSPSLIPHPVSPVRKPDWFTACDLIKCLIANSFDLNACATDKQRVMVEL